MRPTPFLPTVRSAPRALFLAAMMGTAVVASAGCQQQADTALVLDVAGEFPDARTLFFRLVDDNGPRATINQVGDEAHPVSLPAAVSVSASATPKLLGAIVWLTD